ncbi:MAG: 1-acyl-sn-glycerol-3-phosphate acyltransferase [Pseudomonadales bacterium]
MSSDEFQDIRPFNDGEVPVVLDQLSRDPELINAVIKLKYPALLPWLGWLLRPLAGHFIRRQISGVHDVRSFQLVTEVYMQDMIDSKCQGLSWSGIDSIDPQHPNLLISNHRDIAMDPALINMVLHLQGMGTSRIAIGDNLLSRDWISKLMRVNKSFIVKRSLTAPRQMLAAFRQLSAYIRHSLEVDKSMVWIAQRQGRAKDGYDQTEPAMIKMLCMNKSKGESFADKVAALRILPVAISYELDPCDAAKARELFLRESEGEYKKEEQEDIASIAMGIAGEKGHVHVAFGEMLAGHYDTPEAVAEAMDQQISTLYVLHPTNYFAWKLLYGEYPEGIYGSDNIVFDISQLAEEERHFTARINAIPKLHRPYALANYANAIRRKKEFEVAAEKHV